MYIYAYIYIYNYIHNLHICILLYTYTLTNLCIYKYIYNSDDIIEVDNGLPYTFDAENLFENEYLDVILEQIEKELGMNLCIYVTIYA
jgi:hypothetical protein